MFRTIHVANVTIIGYWNRGSYEMIVWKLGMLMENEGILDRDGNLTLRHATNKPFQGFNQCFFITCLECGNHFKRYIGLNVLILFKRGREFPNIKHKWKCFNKQPLNTAFKTIWRICALLTYNQVWKVSDIILNCIECTMIFYIINTMIINLKCLY